MELFKKGLALKSSYRFAKTNLGSIYTKYGDFERGVSFLEDAYGATRLDQSRGNAEALAIVNNYGVASLGVGENDKAKMIFEKIASSGVRNPIPLLNYAIILVEVLKQKKDAARIISKLKFMSNDREILRKVQELEKKLE
ncbi:MAG: hypothetical protein A2Z20_01245 [Bdellovibrionales bacterium RBG_16_40_8]|nr:MAG: hypothetical protein A2Z20_01245 [Bdellovibrionales bacterium RBG_16_40_8]